jgi:MFS family permease
LLAAAFIAAGYADFPIIAYHFKKNALVGDDTIPLYYAAAMISDAIFALLFGKLFDRIGIKTMIIATFISLFFAPLVFWAGSGWAFAGMILWGIGMGAQESILKAAVADLIPVEKRGTAFGIFNTGFGIFWFLGSALMGYLYDVNLDKLVIFSMGTQLIAIIVLILVVSKRKTKFIGMTD